MGHAVSLYELLVYLRNFFPGLHWQFTGAEITEPDRYSRP